MNIDYDAIACRAYRRYCCTLGLPANTPGYFDLPDRERQAWRAAAVAARENLPPEPKRYAAVPDWHPAAIL